MIHDSLVDGLAAQNALGLVVDSVDHVEYVVTVEDEAYRVDASDESFVVIVTT